MIDHATKERCAWIARMQGAKRPVNWVLDPQFRPRANESVDREIRARLDKIRRSNG